MSSKVRFKPLIDSKDEKNSKTTLAATSKLALPKNQSLPVAIALTQEDGPHHSIGLQPAIVDKINASLGKPSSKPIETRLRRAANEANTEVYNYLLSNLDAQGTKFSLMLCVAEEYNLHVARCGEGQVQLNFDSIEQGPRTLFNRTGNQAYIGSNFQVAPEYEKYERLNQVSGGHLMTNASRSNPEKQRKAVEIQKSSTFSLVDVGVLGGSGKQNTGALDLSRVVPALLGLLLLVGLGSILYFIAPILPSSINLPATQTTEAAPVTASATQETATVQAIASATQEAMAAQTVATAQAAVATQEAVAAQIIATAQAAVATQEAVAAQAAVAIQEAVAAQAVATAQAAISTQEAVVAQAALLATQNTLEQVEVPTFQPPVPAPIPPTPTLLPPTLTFTPVPQAETPTLEQLRSILQNISGPKLLKPQNGLTLEAGSPVEFEWRWEGDLEEFDLYFDIRRLHNEGWQGIEDISFIDRKPTNNVFRHRISQFPRGNSAEVEVCVFIVREVENGRVEVVEECKDSRTLIVNTNSQSSSGGSTKDD